MNWGEWLSAYWRLAIWGAAWVSAGAALLGAVIWFLYGTALAGAFLYGAGIGLISFVSTALTVPLLMGCPQVFGIMVGMSSFAIRYGFAAGALGVPAYLGLWPVAAMLGGFAGVYLAENVVLLPKVLMAKYSTGRSVQKRVERRIEV